MDIKRTFSSEAVICYMCITLSRQFIKDMIVVQDAESNLSERLVHHLFNNGWAGTCHVIWFGSLIFGSGHIESGWLAVDTQ